MPPTVDHYRPEVLACLRITGGEWPEGFAARWEAWKADGGDRPEMMADYGAWRGFCLREGLIQPDDFTGDGYELSDHGRFVLLMADERVRGKPAADEPPAGPASPYLTLGEAAAYCRRKPQTLSNHKARGKLKAVPGTRPPLFRREELDAWMNGRPRR